MQNQNQEDKDEKPDDENESDGNESFLETEKEDFVSDDEEIGLPEGKIRTLKAKLAQCEKDRLEYLSGWQRAKADFINARREEEEARKNVFSFAEEAMLQSFLPVADSFELAYANKEAWEKVDENWRKGVEYIHSQLLKVFEEYGLKELSPLGEIFDPAFHESVASVPTEKENEHNTVIAVVQKGYALNGKIVRPAKVKVAEFKERW